MDLCVRERKAELVDRLACLVNADRWAWSLIAPTAGGEKPVPVDFSHRGFNERQLAAFLKAVEHQDMAILNEPILNAMRREKKHVTRRRVELDPGDCFPKMDVYQHWQEADIEHVLISAHPLSDDAISIIGFYRSESSGPFDERDSSLVQALLSEVDFLHERSGKFSPNPKRFDFLLLSPRQRSVLNLLLESWPRKQIAHHLQLSENTISGYIKEVYRFYEVNSHPELIKLFRDNDGRPGPPRTAYPEQ